MPMPVLSPRFRLDQDVSIRIQFAGKLGQHDRRGVHLGHNRRTGQSVARSELGPLIKRGGQKVAVKIYPVFVTLGVSR